MRLNWIHTWPGENAKDYIAKVEGGFARVYLSVQVPGEARWFWTASREVHIASGHELTAEDAARKAEAALLGPE